MRTIYLFAHTVREDVFHPDVFMCTEKLLTARKRVSIFSKLFFVSSVYYLTFIHIVF